MLELLAVQQGFFKERSQRLGWWLSILLASVSNYNSKLLTVQVIKTNYLLVAKIR